VLVQVARRSIAFVRDAWRGAATLAVAAAIALAVVSIAVMVARPAYADVTGLWKVSCTYVKSAQDDPIVAPNQPGASHLHDFFGNVGVNAYSTAASMAGVRSSCAANDRSSYWVPALYRDGMKVNPSSFVAYYENRFADGTKVSAFPPGFQVVFGDRTATSGGQVDDHIGWGCSDNTHIGGHEPPSDCDSGAIQLRIQWPNCWDGRTVATPGATHVSFAVHGKCSAQYPVALPTLRTNIVYPVGTNTGTISLASGSVYSVHADFFNGWDQATLSALVATCLNGLKDCGHYKGASPGREPTSTSRGMVSESTNNTGTTMASDEPSAQPSPTASPAVTVDPTPTATLVASDPTDTYEDNDPALIGDPYDPPPGSTPEVPRSIISAVLTPTRMVSLSAFVLVPLLVTAAYLVLRRRRAANLVGKAAS
jgi:hypothetical protein